MPLCIQPKCRKIGTRITPNTDTFLAVYAIKPDLKEAAGYYASNLATKSDSASPKTEISKIKEIDKTD